MLQRVTVVCQQECGYIARTEDNLYVGILGERPDVQECDTVLIFLPPNIHKFQTSQKAQEAFCDAISAIEKLGVYPYTTGPED